MMNDGYEMQAHVLCSISSRYVDTARDINLYILSIFSCYFTPIFYYNCKIAMERLFFFIEFIHF